MSEFSHTEEALRRKAALELTRIVRELIIASGKTYTQITMLMGYKSRTTIYTMYNYQYGQSLYPEWLLHAFLRAVGVRWPQDVEYVLSIYHVAAGREGAAARASEVIVRPKQREWWKDSPEANTEEVPIHHAKRRELAQVLAT